MHRDHTEAAGASGRVHEVLCTHLADSCVSRLLSQLLSHIEKLRSSMMEDLSADNVFYKRRVEELGQKVQEQNELILSQRQQVHPGGVHTERGPHGERSAPGGSAPSTFGLRTDGV